jgi:non-ribosomal peptide synthetase component F
MPKLLHELLSSQAAARPSKIAVCWKDETIPFGELDQVSNQLANTLRAHGCQFGDRVAVLIPNSANALLGVLGTLKAGCIAVPIDVTAPAAQVIQILNECQPTMILVTRLAQSMLDELFDNDYLPYRLGTLEALPIEGEYFATEFTGLCILRESSEAPDCGATTHAPAMLFCRSGEFACGVNAPMSRPVFQALASAPRRPTVVTHAEVLAFLTSRQRFQLTDCDRVLGLPLQSPLAVAEAFASLAVGSELHIVPPDLMGQPRKLARFVRSHQLTEWLTNHGSLSEVIQSSEIRDGDLPSLKYLLWSGRALPARMMYQLTQQLPLTQFARITGQDSKFGGEFSEVTCIPEFEPILTPDPQPALVPA